MHFDPTFQKYPSRRYPIYARGGMVNASSPQASAAGLEMLRKGGNAVDAAIATAAALTVVEPTANGLGGDAFALVWMNGEGKLHGLNSSGPAPKGISIQKVLENGQDDHGKMPSLGWTPVTVPGIPKAWAELSRRFGRLPLSQVVAPAIRYAREGYPCAPNLAKFWKRGLEKYRAKLPDTLFEEWFRTFCPLGRAYEAGEIIRLPDHGDTIEAIGETGADAYYHGHLADKIDAASRAGGGYLRKEDLEAYEARWVDPISVDYRGYRVWEIPSNGQGLVALIGLNILKEFQVPTKGLCRYLSQAVGSDEDGFRRWTALHHRPGKRWPSTTTGSCCRNMAASGRSRSPAVPWTARPRSLPPGHRLSLRRRWGREHDLLYPKQLQRFRLRRGDPRHRHRHAEPGQRFFPWILPPPTASRVERGAITPSFPVLSPRVIRRWAPSA